MTEYDNTTRGALFRNNKKQTDKQPDYTGSLNVGGVDYWLSGWVKVSQNGTKFFSVSVQPKEEQSTSARPTPKTRKPDPISTGLPRNDMNDEIPFAPEFR